MENLWPSFEKKQEQTPKSILLKQAEFFNALDIGLRAYVTSIQAQDEDFLSTDEKVWIIHTFRIQASSLDGFTFTLFRAKHKTLAIYPVEVYDNLSGVIAEAKTPEDMNMTLSTLFNSDDVKIAIQNLITQIK